MKNEKMNNEREIMRLKLSLECVKRESKDDMMSMNSLICDLIDFIDRDEVKKISEINNRLNNLLKISYLLMEYEK